MKKLIVLSLVSLLALSVSPLIAQNEGKKPVKTEEKKEGAKSEMKEEKMKKDAKKSEEKKEVKKEKAATAPKGK